jgi:excisionase family DNA binding protein
MPPKKTSKKTTSKTSANKPAKKAAARKADQQPEKAEATQPELITLDEVAKMLKMQPLQVRKMVQRGKIPGVKVEGEWRFNPDLVYSVFHGRSRGR